MLNIRYPKSRLMAALLAAGVTFQGALYAGDCGCESPCNTCSPATPDCSCDSAPLLKKLKGTKGGHNCLYRALDMLAGGIEKALHLDKPCAPKCDDACQSYCDDGCDAAMMREFAWPAVPAPNHSHGHTTQPHIHSSPAPAPAKPLFNDPYTGPTHDVTPTGPSQWGGHSSTPVEVSPPTGQHLGDDVLSVPRESATVPPPVRLRDPKPSARPQTPKPDPRTDRESLFDTLTDPFGDDEARAKAFRSVRPSNYEARVYRPIRVYKDGSPAPVNRIPLSSQDSSRRLKSLR